MEDHRANDEENNEDEDRDIETTMETMNSADKEKKLGRPQLSASEILLRYKTKILEKEKEHSEDDND